MLTLLGFVSGNPLPPPKRKKEVVSAEVRLGRGLYEPVLASLKAARADTRARGVPVPSYPEERDRVRDLLDR